MNVTFNGNLKLRCTLWSDSAVLPRVMTVLLPSPTAPLLPPTAGIPLRKPNYKPNCNPPQIQHTPLKPPRGAAAGLPSRRCCTAPRPSSCTWGPSRARSGWPPHGPLPTGWLGPPASRCVGAVACTTSWREGDRPEGRQRPPESWEGLPDQGQPPHSPPAAAPGSGFRPPPPQHPRDPPPALPRLRLPHPVGVLLSAGPGGTSAACRQGKWREKSALPGALLINVCFRAEVGDGCCGGVPAAWRCSLQALGQAVLTHRHIHSRSPLSRGVWSRAEVPGAAQ